MNDVNKNIKSTLKISNGMKTYLKKFLIGGVITVISVCAFAGVVSAAFVEPPGLIAYFPFNGNADDATGNRATKPTQVKYPETGAVGGYVGGYAYLDGSGDYIRFDKPNDIKLGPQSTIMFWAKRDTDNYVNSWLFEGDYLYTFYASVSSSYHGTGAPYCKYGAQYGITIGHGGVGQTCYLQGNTSYLKDYGWHHFAVVDDGSKIKLYVDGQPDDKNTAPQYMSFNGRNIIRIGFIATKEHGWYQFKGGVDEFKVHNNALSTDQVKNEYCRGRPADPICALPPTPPVVSTPPTVHISGPSTGMPGDKLTFIVSGTDPTVDADVSTLHFYVTASSSGKIKDTSQAVSLLPPNGVLAKSGQEETFTAAWKIAGRKYICALAENKSSVQSVDWSCITVDIGSSTVIPSPVAKGDPDCSTRSIEWLPVSGASYYEYSTYSASSGLGPISSTTATKLSSLADNTYYVRTVAPSGTSDWSEFVMKCANPCSVCNYSYSGSCVAGLQSGNLINTECASSGCSATDTRSCTAPTIKCTGTAPVGNYVIRDYDNTSSSTWSYIENDEENNAILDSNDPRIKGQCKWTCFANDNNYTYSQGVNRCIATSIHQ
jgi:hypothetical protein